MARQCSRPGCSEDAAATLTYEYRNAQVWIDPLAAERDPHAYDMCQQHSDRLRPPQGWQIRDRRQSAAPLIAVSA